MYHERRTSPVRFCLCATSYVECINKYIVHFHKHSYSDRPNSNGFGEILPRTSKATSDERRDKFRTRSGNIELNALLQLPPAYVV